MQFQKTPWKHDPLSKNFSHDKLFGTVSPLTLPETLGRAKRPIENQGATLRCTAYASAVNGGYIWGEHFEPGWQADKITKIQGRNIDEYGADPNSAMKSQRDYGYAPSSDPVDEVAIDYRVAGYVKVDGVYDIFDDIRSALYQAYNKETGRGAVVQAFGRFFNEWNTSIIPQHYTSFAGYHCWLFIDWVKYNGVDYLVAQNSYGQAYGEGGLHYFPREVVNREFTISGTTLKIVKPLTKAQIEEAKKQTPLGALWRLLLTAWYNFSERFGRV
jgi:hypothetical protein